MGARGKDLLRLKREKNGKDIDRAGAARAGRIDDPPILRYPRSCLAELAAFLRDAKSAGGAILLLWCLGAWGTVEGSAVAPFVYTCSSACAFSGSAW